MRLLDAIKSSSDYLEKSGIDDPLADAEILVLHAAGIDRLRAYMDNPEADQRLVSRTNRLVKRRAAGEPLQYIVGHVDFLGLEIKVGKGVLIPRPETELLVEEAIKTVKSKMLNVKSSKKPQIPNPKSPCFLDLCTGSGCIALALAKEFPDAQVYATDVSAKAMRYARANADCNGIGNVTFLKGPLFTPVAERIASFDLITANPPYIRTSDISGLQREVREWEPLRALDGGENGLDFYRKILSKASVFLKKGGGIFFELGFGQAGAVTEIAAHAGLKNIELTKDVAGIDRVLKAKRQ